MSDETKPDLPANSVDTSNTALDIVTDLALDATIPAPIRRNALKAFGQLCTAAIDWPVAYFEGKASEIRAQTEARIKIVKENVDQITQQMKVDPEYAQLAVSKYGQKILKEQVTLEKISAIAADELKKAIVIEATNQRTGEPNKEVSAEAINQGENTNEEKTIDDVWLNIFETEARPRSTEEAQLLFGRILAGEIKQPGSYSIKAVKLLGELDQSIAALFKKLCSACVVYGVFGIPSEQVFDARVSSISGNPGSNALRKYGLGFDQLNLLNGYDLIISDYNSWFDYKMCIVNQGNPVLLPFQYQGKHWVLSPLPEQENKPELRISGVALSHVGRELYHIVDQNPMPEYTQDLKKFFAKKKLQMVEVPNPGPIMMNSTIADTESEARLENIARDKTSFQEG